MKRIIIFRAAFWLYNPNYGVGQYSGIPGKFLFNIRIGYRKSKARGPLANKADSEHPRQL